MASNGSLVEALIALYFNFVSAAPPPDDLDEIQTQIISSQISMYYPVTTEALVQLPYLS